MPSCSVVRRLICSKRSGIPINAGRVDVEHARAQGRRLHADEAVDLGVEADHEALRETIPAAELAVDGGLRHGGGDGAVDAPTLLFLLVGDLLGLLLLRRRHAGGGRRGVGRLRGIRGRDDLGRRGRLGRRLRRRNGRFVGERRRAGRQDCAHEEGSRHGLHRSDSRRRRRRRATAKIVTAAPSPTNAAPPRSPGMSEHLHEGWMA